mmetsp:Transcript_16548/g.29147  ORF Transcript_16548/g.29147 Transcript_16548/m.29147 type:complete len:232 (-) Transcript_16548:1231-1926(-)
MLVTTLCWKQRKKTSPKSRQRKLWIFCQSTKLWRPFNRKQLAMPPSRHRAPPACPRNQQAASRWALIGMRQRLHLLMRRLLPPPMSGYLMPISVLRARGPRNVRKRRPGKRRGRRRGSRPPLLKRRLFQALFQAHTSMKARSGKREKSRVELVLMLMRLMRQLLPGPRIFVILALPPPSSITTPRWCIKRVLVPCTRLLLKGVTHSHQDSAHWKRAGQGIPSSLLIQTQKE